MGDERHAEADGACRDPAIAVVELVAEGMAGLLAPQAELGAGGDHLVVGLDHSDLGDAGLRSPASQLAPPASQRAEAELHDRLEGEQGGPRADEVSVGSASGCSRS